MKRLDHDADNFEDVKLYFKQKAKQLAHDNVILLDIEELPGKVGGIAYFSKSYRRYSSIYINKSERGKGYYSDVIKLGYCIDAPIVTTSDCDIVDYLESKDIRYHLAGELLDTVEYKAISKYYGEDKTKRSKIFFMNHIDEGMTILNEIGASDNAMKAFMVHPIYQTDLENSIELNRQLNPDVAMLAMEYRNIANRYLSHDKVENISDIELSPLPEVNQMLVADKIQNYKDFCLYHRHKHERSNELERYFNDWFIRLNLDWLSISKLIKRISN